MIAAQCPLIPFSPIYVFVRQNWPKIINNCTACPRYLSDGPRYVEFQFHFDDCQSFLLIMSLSLDIIQILESRHPSNVANCGILFIFGPVLEFGYPINVVLKGWP